MKKFVVGAVVVLWSALLVGCGSSPEQVYIDALNPELDKVEDIGVVLNTLGDDLLDDNFNAATTTLINLQDAVDALQLPSYAGADASLITVESSLNTLAEQTNTLIETIEPVITKVANDPNLVATPEDEAALARTESLTKTISEAMDAASLAMEEYEATVQ